MRGREAGTRSQISDLWGELIGTRCEGEVTGNQMREGGRDDNQMREDGMTTSWMTCERDAGGNQIREESGI